jgi:hypothetical protein
MALDVEQILRREGQAGEQSTWRAWQKSRRMRAEGVQRIAYVAACSHAIP